MTEAELVIDLRAELTEGPWWDPSSNRLVFVDILSGRFFRWDPAASALDVTETGAIVSATVPRAPGGMLLVQRDRVVVRDKHGYSTTLSVIEHDHPGARLNDAKCDPAGRLFVGSMVGAATPGAGSLFMVDGTGSVRTVVAGTTISNGMGWSLDASTMYFVDSPTGAVDAFDFDVSTGHLGYRRTIVRFAEDEGKPDGMTVDSEDHLWVASFGGGFVRRYTADGTAAGTITLPVANVTSCAFGGPALDELFITTARVDLSERELADQPYAGGVFRARPGVRGRLDNAFAEG